MKVYAYSIFWYYWVEAGWGLQFYFPEIEWYILYILFYYKLII